MSANNNDPQERAREGGSAHDGGNRGGRRHRRHDGPATGGGHPRTNAGPPPPRTNTGPPPPGFQQNRQPRVRRPPVPVQYRKNDDAPPIRPTNENGGERASPPPGFSNTGGGSGAGGGGGGNNNRRDNFQRPPKKAKDRRDHAGIRMTGYITDCFICCQRSDLYAVGACLHPMCMECAIRTRILGKSNLCPQCRAEVGTLHFVSSRPTRDYAIPESTVPFKDEQRLGVKFESEYALECFNSYLAHKCHICTNRDNSPDSVVAFPNFAALQMHMTRTHLLTYCYLCTDNLNTLTKDRRTYTRHQLQRHMDGSEPTKDDGFQGHPKCLFCEQRFYDDEQQYRHLRKDHFFCQICDTDGADNFFYKTHGQLMHHYRRSHYPCTHDDCLPAGIVFRSDVELNVHKAKQHCQGRKMMQLDFPISNGSGVGGSSRGGGAGPSSSGRTGDQQSNQHVPPPGPPPPAPIYTIIPSAQTGQRAVRIVPSAAAFNAAQNGAEFPLLEQYQQLQPPYGAPPNWKQSQQEQAFRNARTGGPSLPLQSGEQFPGLPSNSGQTSTSASTTSRRGGGAQAAAASTVWAKGKTRDLFNNQPTSSMNSAKQPAAGAETTTKRKKVIPLPDAFPEGMREVLRARQMGLPDPPVESVPPSHADRFEEMKRVEKKEKKKKSKMVPASVAAQKIANDFVPSSTSRFESLCDESSDDENAKAGKAKNNWWSSSVKPAAPTLRESSDDFVRIDLGHNAPVSLRRALPEAAADSNEAPAPKVPISLSTIAAGLHDDAADATATEKAETSASTRQKTDELELLRHQRTANYRNDYNLQNEDLDMQMALEMSLLSSQLFLPPASTAAKSSPTAVAAAADSSGSAAVSEEKNFQQKSSTEKQVI